MPHPNFHPPRCHPKVATEMPACLALALITPTRRSGSSRRSHGQGRTTQGEPGLRTPDCPPRREEGNPFTLTPSKDGTQDPETAKTSPRPKPPTNTRDRLPLPAHSAEAEAQRAVRDVDSGACTPTHRSVQSARSPTLFPCPLRQA